MRVTVSRRIAIAALTLGLIAPLATTTATAAAAVRETYIVVLEPGANGAAAESAARSLGGSVRFSYQYALNGFAVEIPAPAASALVSIRGVRYIEKDGPVHIAAEQSGATWGIDRVDQRDLPLNGKYNYPDTGAVVRAYVIDTGVLSGHNEFTGRVLDGHSVINDNLRTEDCDGHGTHVAGTIAGTTYGVAKSARIVPVRVLDCSGSGSYSGVIAGVDWVKAQRVAAPTIPMVANMSLGGGKSSTLNDAVASLVASGVTVAVAAGNSNRNACNYSPASEPLALTVGATTSSDARSSFSNFGSCLDLFAPGSAITSAWITSTSSSNTISGTSMASPHVAGLAAVFLAAYPSATPATVASSILGAATTGKVKSAGTGSPNRLAFLTTTLISDGSSSSVTKPAAPTGVTALAVGGRKIDVTWVQGSNGGSALTQQTVYVYASGTLASKITGISPSASTVRIGGLKVGTFYTFRVSATNAVGEGNLSLASDPPVAAR
jgi:subtilisin family serine protease